MNKNISSILILCFLVSSACAQYGQTKKTRKDFNKDGVIDQVTVTEDGGSAFSFKYNTFYDGRTKKTYKFDVSYSFGSFFSVCKVPDILGKKGSEVMGDFLFGRKDSIDPSLNWLIDATSSGGKKYKPIWISGEPKIPNGYYTIIEAQNYKAFLTPITDASYLDVRPTKKVYCWIDYNSFGHYSQVRRRGSDTVKVEDFKINKVDSLTSIYTTANGVIIKRGSKYSWVFISDNQAGTSINEKLRWPTIVDAKMFHGIVLILQQQLATNFLVMVNPNTGDIISLNEDSGIYAIEEMKLGNDSVELKNRDGEIYLLTQDKIDEFLKNN